MGNHAGESIHIDEGAEWLHGSVATAEWPADTPAEYKNAKYGDRRQELVLIGRNLSEAEVRKTLEAALVTEDEFQSGLECWAQWANPFRVAVVEEAGEAGTLEPTTVDMDVDKESTGSHTSL